MSYTRLAKTVSHRYNWWERRTNRKLNRWRYAYELWAPNNKEALQRLAETYRGHGDINGVLKWARQHNARLEAPDRINQKMRKLGIVDGRHPALPYHYFMVNVHTEDTYVIADGKSGAVIAPFPLRAPALRQAIGDILVGNTLVRMNSDSRFMQNPS